MPMDKLLADTIAERDLLAKIVKWYDDGILHLREGLGSRIAEYNALGARHVVENAAEKKPDGPVG